MKSILLFTIAVAAFGNLQAQATLEWVHSFGGGGSSNDKSYQVQIDSDGNVFVGGFFQDVIDADPGAGIVNLQCTAITTGGNAFLAKYTSTGELLWANVFTSTLASAVTCIALDEDDNPVVGGYFNSNMDADPSAQVHTLNMNGGMMDAFVAKYNSGDGSLNWVFTLGNTLNENISGLWSDGLGNILVVGPFALTMDFDGSDAVYDFTSDGDYINIFMAKYTTGGDFVWVKNITSAHAGNETFGWVDAVDFDADGNFIIAGNFSDVADFDPGDYEVELTGEEWTQEGFIAKYTADGELLFVRGFIGDDDSGCHTVKMDAAGNCFVAGYFSSAVDIDPGPSTQLFTADDSQDIFIVKLDLNGNLVWADHLAGTSSCYAHARTMDMDQSGNIYLGCTYRFAVLDVDPGAGTTLLDGENDYHIFIATYNSNGAFINVSEIRSTLPYSHADIASMKLDEDHLMVTGCFSTGMDFDCSSGEHLLSSIGDADFFIARYLVQNISNNIHDAGDAHSFLLYPNPVSNTLYLRGGTVNSPVRIMTMQGMLVSEQPYRVAINIESLAPGIYMAEHNGTAIRFIKF